MNNPKTLLAECLVKANEIQSFIKNRGWQIVVVDPYKLETTEDEIDCFAISDHHKSPIRTFSMEKWEATCFAIAGRKNKVLVIEHSDVESLNVEILNRLNAGKTYLQAILELLPNS